MDNRVPDMASDEINPDIESGTNRSKEPHTVLQNGVLETHFDGDDQPDEEYQGPHDWRKRLKPVKSPIHDEDSKNSCDETDQSRSLGSRAIKDSRKVKDKFDEGSKAEKPRRIPSWKRHLIEKKKKGSTKLFRQGSGAGSSSTAQGTPGVYRKKSFNKNNTESTFTQQVVNNGISHTSSFKRRISPSNSFNKPVPVSHELTKKRIEKVQRARLYLLQQAGPNSFLIGGDSPDHKFRVIIGPQSCSCGKGPHCVHVLFVMLRVFQVSQSDPCLWSKTLKNYEVENLFREYHDKVSSRIRNRKMEEKHKQTKKTDTGGTPSPESTPAPSEADVGSIKEDEDTCPICLLEMLEGESLLKCENGCQNRLHHHCIAVWFELCRRQNDPLICPLCRAKWKTNNVEVKSESAVETNQTPVVPPNSRAESPHTVQPERETRLPYTEPIPQEYVEISAPWVEVLGEDLVSCFFTRNWSIRETGLKHLSTEVVGVLMRSVGEGRSGTVISPIRQATTHRMLECCYQILAFMCTDPVYKVYVASLRTLRTVLSYTPCREENQRARLQTFLKPVIDAIVFKCTDGMRKTSQLSLSTILEVAKSQDGELAVGKEILNPGITGLDGFNYVIKCVTEDYVPSDVTWQWLLGRLYVIEKLFDDFQNELLPRNPPEGKSGDETSSSVGASSGYHDDTHNFSSQDRLLAIAKFSIKAVTNSHMRICRMARRVFWLCARFSAHMDSIIEELEAMVDKLDSNIALSMKRRLLKIVGEFQLSEKLVHELHHGSSRNGKHFDDSVENSPGDTPVSSPRCNSPVTSHSDCQSEAGYSENKLELMVPPNTPVRYRRRRKERRLGKDLHEDELKTAVDVFIEEKVARPKVKAVKNLNPPEENAILTSTPGRPSEKQSPPPPVPPRSNRRGSVDLLNELSELAPHPRIKRFNSCDITNNNALNSITPNDLMSLSVNKQDFSLPLPGTFNSSVRKRDLTLPFGDNKPVDNSASSDIDKNEEYFSDIACASPIIPENRVVECSGIGDGVTPTSNQPKYDSTTEFQMYFHSSDERTLSSDDSLDRLSNRRRSRQRERFPTAEQGATSSDEILDMTSNSEVMSPSDRAVTFKTEVTMPTPKNSPGHVTEHKDNEECHCKEEVEKEEALALAKAMEVSGIDPPKPIVPGLTPTDREEVITIRVQPDNYESKSQDNNGNPPQLYLENVHWVKGPLLGTGAYSTCYQARDVQTGVIMAVKQISYCRNSPTEQEQVVETITEEIQMMAKLNHPNIVRIMGATRQGCHFNMFNEWMPGGSLAYLLSQYGAFAENVTVNYTLQILRGLAYLHECHILHRDLKGANLLVDSTGQRLRIGDFGAAARLASQATGAGEFQGQLLGTIAYMAPEVLRGEDYGRACDVWSVGCVIIEMSTRNPPWDAKAVSNHLALIFKIATSVTPPPIPEKLSPPLRDILLRCLEQNKGDRPSAKDLLVHPLFTQYLPKK